MVTNTQLSLEDFKTLLKNTEVSCAMCSWQGHSLIRHLSDLHTMSPGQYKKRFPTETHPHAKLFSPLVLDLLKRIPRTAHAEDEDLGQITQSMGLGQIVMTGQFDALKPRLPAQDPNKIKNFEVPILNPNFKFPKDSTEALLLGLILGKNVYMSGPSGCGKTELAMQVHAQLGRPMLRANMNGDMTAAKFIGSMRIDPVKGTTYKYGMLPLAMRAGVPILMDEADYTPPSIATVLNPVLEGKRMIYIEETDETIHALPGFMIIGAGNTSGKGDPNGNYTGTEIMNTALLDRFAIKLNCDYMEDKEEISLLHSTAKGLAPVEVASLVKVAGLIRGAFKEGNLSITLSTRKLLDYAELRQEGQTTQQALNLTLLNWLDDNDRTVVSEMVNRAWPGVIQPAGKSAKRP